MKEGLLHFITYTERRFFFSVKESNILVDHIIMLEKNSTMPNIVCMYT